jgi:hypothetical protein
MPPKFAKKDRVKVLATRFDKEELEEGEQKFSDKWAADGHGIWCYGQIVHVYVKKARKPQEYNIRYDNGESMKGLEDHLEIAGDDSDESEDDNMVDPSSQCVQIRLGLKKVVTGINKGTMRAVQGRCTSCRARNKKQEKRGRAPNTAWGCVCHPGEYFCKNKTCWSEHLRQVRLDHEVEMEI